MSEPQSAYLTVSEAAARLKVSERTIRRRCETGKLKADLQPTATGSAWHIEADSCGQVRPNTRTSAAIGADTFSSEDQSQNRSERADTAANSSDRLGQAAAIGADTPNAADLLAQSREEIHFLRGLIEQRDRDAAELRAALREALRAMPKAIEAASGSTPTVKNATGKNTTEAARSGEPAQPAPSTPNAPQRPSQREMRPLWKVILGIR